jgi:hypothetical protein
MPDWRGYRTFGVTEPDLSGNATNRESAGRYGTTPSTVYNPGALRVSFAPRLPYPRSVVTRMPTYRTALLALVARLLCSESDLSPSSGSSKPMRSRRSVRFCVRRSPAPSAPSSPRRRQETQTPTKIHRAAHQFEFVDYENEARLPIRKKSFSLERKEIRHESNHFGKK